MKSYLFVGLLIFIISCMSNSGKNDYDYLEKSDHAVIKIHVPDNSHYDRYLKLNFPYRIWRIRIAINDRIIIKRHIKGGGESQFLVPTGSLKLNYLILAEYEDSMYKTGNSFFGFFENKLLFLSAKKNENFILKIINVGKVQTGLGCVGSQGVFIPFPKRYQEVAFEVEKIEPAATKQNSGGK